MIYKKANSIAILDIETTDRYGNSCGVVQLAAVVVDNQMNVVDQFNERCRTTHKINPEASAVHGIYAKDLVNCRSEKEVLSDFCAGMNGNNVDLILTYNGEAFDRRVLDNRCDALGIDTDYFNKDKFPGIDGYYNCVKIAKDKNMWGLKDFLGRKGRLTLVSECLGIDKEGAHDAFEDVRMLRTIWTKLDPIIHPEDWTEDGETSDRSLF